MLVTYLTNKKDGVVLLPPAWYMAISHPMKTKTDCRDAEDGKPVAGFFLKEDRLLVFLTYSGRPGYDKVIAVLLDVGKGKLVTKLELGMSKEEIIPVFKTNRGYKLRIVKEYISEVQCDCSAAFIDDWLEVRLERDSLKSNWIN